MKVLVTGSAGHLGEALMGLLPTLGHTVKGLDRQPSPFTHWVGDITDRTLIRQALPGVEAIVHTATLHKPHLATHSKQAFVDTNINGTLTLLEEAQGASVDRIVFTSTTSTYGRALSSPPDTPAAWVDEDLKGVTKNIYGATKTAAEDLCALFARNHGVHVVVLRTARFFPEADDSRAVREGFSDVNAKANEFLFRRVDLEDAATAHAHALERVRDIGFGVYVISATSPFGREDLSTLRRDPAAVVAAHYPGFSAVYAQRRFAMFADIDRVYINARARRDLGWQPRYDFGRILQQLADGSPIGSPLARAVGSKGYHAEGFADGHGPVLEPTPPGGARPPLVSPQPPDGVSGAGRQRPIPWG
ncbi:MAG: NAD-dependent epimerase/dehydratase family protein [Candidatus Competibacterales bacterium]